MLHLGQTFFNLRDKVTNILIHKKIKIAFFYQKTLPEIIQEGFSYLWSHLGSNQGPPDYESGALTS